MLRPLRCAAVCVCDVACYRPIRAFQRADGAVVFVERGEIRRALFLSCGQCIGCRETRARHWAVRCMHEAQLHASNWFVTLTYSDENLSSLSLVYRHFQLFMKRLVSRCGPVRFFMCGEYGDESQRPHFHALLFGLELTDLVFYKETEKGRLWTSPFLESVWQKGFVVVGAVTMESASYVSRYVLKKRTGDMAREHYEAVDGDTGEVVDREPEFCRMSLRPGIGASWFDRYGAEVFGPDGTLDRVVLEGKEMSPPKYYLKLLARKRAEDSEYVRWKREEAAGLSDEERSSERLKVRERCAQSRARFKRRSAV